MDVCYKSMQIRRELLCERVASKGSLGFHFINKVELRIVCTVAA